MARRLVPSHGYLHASSTDAPHLFTVRYTFFLASRVCSHSSKLAANFDGAVFALALYLRRVERREALDERYM